MTITVIPFTVDRAPDLTALPIGGIEGRTEKSDLPITYWGIYLDDKQVSFVSNKELAEKTKIWMEKWLSDRLILVSGSLIAT